MDVQIAIVEWCKSSETGEICAKHVSSQTLRCDTRVKCDRCQYITDYDNIAYRSQLRPIFSYKCVFD